MENMSILNNQKTVLFSQGQKMESDKKQSITLAEIETLLAKGEDTRTQFKKNITNINAMALEIIAFANALGGKLLIGVDDNGMVVGLSDQDIHRLNQLVSNASSQNVVPPIYPMTELVKYDNKNIMIVTVPYGTNKPYATKDGRYVTRAGADKRMISNEEMRRLYQESGKLYAEEMHVQNANWDDIDLELFSQFYRKKYGELFAKEELPRIFENLNLASDNHFNLAGALLFGRNDIERLFYGNQVICVSFFGNDITGTEYRDSDNSIGNLKKLFEQGRAFVNRNLKRLQNGKNFNTIGDPEIPPAVIDELLVNALLHRDFFISSNIRILIFDNRVEIISPGKLPNHLTVEKVMHGVSIKRNPTLCSFAFDVLPFRGIGSGILRALKLYPNIEFVNDEEIATFKAIIHRPKVIPS